MKNEEKRRDSAAASAVPEAGGAILSAVSSLMEERRRFEAWIAALEARRASTPEHVFARVHADYSSRLNTVISQLTTHADGLRRELDSLTMRLDVLRDERQRAEDARSEAELRAHVGELSPEDWSTTAAASDASLLDIGDRQQSVEQELARTKELLESAERPVVLTPSVAQEPVPEPEPEPEPVPAPAPAPAPAPVAAAPAPAPAAPAAPRASVPAPAVSAPPSVAIAPTAAPAAPPAQAATEPPADQQSLGIVEHMMPRPSRATPHPSPNAIPTPPARNSSFDELAFLSSVVDAPSGSIEDPPADMPDEATRLDSFARRSQEEAAVNLTESGNVPVVPPPTQDYEREPDSILSSGSNRAISRDSTGVDGAKTLKCSECGAMNYPTEWYCERCGAELASL